MTKILIDEATVKLVLKALEKSTDNFPANVQHTKAIAALREALAEQPAQPAPEYCDPSSSIYGLAEMVMSDCGHSSNNQRLLDKIAARIQSHIDAAAPQPAQQECHCNQGQVCHVCDPIHPPTQRKPLTADELWKMWNAEGNDAMDRQEAIAFARAIEAAHGIKGDA